MASNPRKKIIRLVAEKVTVRARSIRRVKNMKVRVFVSDFCVSPVTLLRRDTGISQKLSMIKGAESWSLASFHPIKVEHHILWGFISIILLNKKRREAWVVVVAQIRFRGVIQFVIARPIMEKVKVNIDLVLVFCSV